MVPMGVCPTGISDCVGEWQGSLLGAVVISVALIFAIRNQIKSDMEKRGKEKFQGLSKDLRPRRRRLKHGAK